MTGRLLPLIQNLTRKNLIRVIPNASPSPGHAHEIKRVRNKNLVAQAVAVGRMDGGDVRLEMLKMREGGVAAAAAAHL